MIANTLIHLGALFIYFIYLFIIIIIIIIITQMVSGDALLCQSQ